MNEFVFIHGSSDGQSVHIPQNAPKELCEDIANKYFSGRTARLKQSAAKIAMFVDLYQSRDQQLYCIYTLINNICISANERPGQYFALSLACKHSFVYPESVYKMLLSAYTQMVDTNRIIKKDDQYVISQFKEEKEYLSKFLALIEDAFQTISKGNARELSAQVSTADYDSWTGTKVDAETCNSMASYQHLCRTGRLYISDEYGSASQKISALEQVIKKLEKEKEEREQQAAQEKNAKESEEGKKIKQLHAQIAAYEERVQTLSEENSHYQSAIEAVSKELKKYEKVGKAIHNIQEKVPQYPAKDRKSLVKICLLFIILFITLISGLMNYAFFRGLPEDFKKVMLETRPGKNPPEMPQQGQQTAMQQEQQEPVGYEPSGISQHTHVEADVLQTQDPYFTWHGGSQTIAVPTGCNWEQLPEHPQPWITLIKNGNHSLTLIVQVNTESTPRRCTFTLECASGETKQIRIYQEKYEPTLPYGVKITDETGKELQKNDTVRPGQKLTATVSKHIGLEGYGWSEYHCEGDGENTATYSFTVNQNAKEKMVISYGRKGINHGQEREKFQLIIANQ